MPPKQRGAHLYGKTKLFRHAVLDVHVGTGHTVLGNAVLLAPTLPPLSPADVHGEGRSTFHRCLDELALSFTTPNFKQFRYDWTQQTISVADVRSLKNKLANTLLEKLADSKDEAFRAWLELTIALCRDVGRSFLTYYESFFLRVNDGLFDEDGKLIVSTDRLQMVYLTQAGWLRELASVFSSVADAEEEEEGADDCTGGATESPPEDLLPLAPVIDLYLKQFLDSKEYIRRLSAETLATLSRRLPTTLQLVAQQVDSMGSEADAASSEGWVESLSVFFAEMLRGLKGALHSRFRHHFGLLVRYFFPNKTSTESESSLSRGEALASCMEQLIEEVIPRMMSAKTSSLDAGTTFRHLEDYPPLLIISTVQRFFRPTAVWILVLHRIIVAGKSIMRHLPGPQGEQSIPEAVWASLTKEFPFLATTATPAELGGVAADKKLGKTDKASKILQLLNKGSSEGSAVSGPQAPRSISNTIFAFVQDMTEQIGRSLTDSSAPVGSNSGAALGELLTELSSPSLQSLAVPTDLQSLNRFRKYDSIGDTLRRRWLQFSILPSLLIPGQSSFIQFLSLTERILKIHVGNILQLRSGNLNITPERLRTLRSHFRNGVLPTYSAGFQEDFLSILGALQSESTSSSRGCGGSAHGVPSRLLWLLVSSLKETSLEAGGAVSCFDRSALLSSPLAIDIVTASMTEANAGRPSILQSILKIGSQGLKANTPEGGLTLLLAVEAVSLLNLQFGLSHKGALAAVSTSAAWFASQVIPFAQEVLQFQSKTATQFSSEVLKAKSLSNHVLEQLRSWSPAAQVAIGAAPSIDSSKIDKELILEIGKRSHGTTPSSSDTISVSPWTNRDMVLLEAATKGGLFARLSSSGVGEPATEKIQQFLYRALSCAVQDFRLAALEALRLLDRDAGSDSSKLIYESFSKADSVDPLSTNLDSAKLALTKLMFAAERKQVTNPLHQKIVVCYSLGLLHKKFAAVWPMACQLILSILSTTTSKSSLPSPYWTDFVLPALRRFCVSNSSAAEWQAEDNAVEVKNGSADDSQQPDSLGDEDPVAAVIALERIQAPSGHLIDFTWSTVVSSCTSFPSFSSTDQATLCMTLLKELLTPLLGKAMEGESDSLWFHTVDLLFRMNDDDSKGLPPNDERIAHTLRALVQLRVPLANSKATPSTEPTQSQSPRQQLSGFLHGSLSSKHGPLQAAAAEMLKQLEEEPFASQLKALLPFCQKTADLMRHLSTFNLKDVPTSLQPLFISNALLLAMPKLSNTGREEAIATRRILSLLPALNEDGIREVLDLVMSRLLHGAIHGMDRQGFLLFHSSVQSLSRHERQLKRVSVALRFLDEVSSAIGSKFALWGGRCFALAIRSYAFASLARSTETAQLVRRLAAKRLASTVDQFPSIIVDLIRVSESKHRSGPRQPNVEGSTQPNLFTEFGQVLGLLHHNTGSLPLAGKQERGSIALPALLRIVHRIATEPVLIPIGIAYSDIIAAVLEQCFAVHTVDAGTSSVLCHNDVLVAALQSLIGLLNSSSETVEPITVYTPAPTAPTAPNNRGTKSTASATIRDSFVAKHIEHLFGAMYKVAAGTVTTSAKRLSNRVWRELIAGCTLAAEFVCAFTSGEAGQKAKESLLQLLLLTFKYIASANASPDEVQTLLDAAEMAETLSEKAESLGGFSIAHLRQLTSLMNQVSAPAARRSLVRVCLNLPKSIAALTVQRRSAEGSASGIASTTDAAFALEAIFKTMDGLNAFPTTENGEVDYSTYDFEARHHSLYQIIAAFGERQKGKLNSKSSKRTVQEEKSSDLVTLAASDSILSEEGLALLASNLLYFVRDHQQSIRGLAAQALSSLFAYGAAFPDSQQESFLNVAVRPYVIPSLKQGIVAKDVYIRNEQMKLFGDLIRHYRTRFAGLQSLQSPNEEQDFFKLIGAAQHKLRLNGLALLRKHAAEIPPRHQLTWLFPFLLAGLKDYAQGKRELFANTGEGKAQGFAESLISTIAALTATLPWDGYRHILSILMQQAQEEQSLRRMLLKAVVSILQQFHFLKPKQSNGTVEQEEVAVTNLPQETAEEALLLDEVPIADEVEEAETEKRDPNRPTRAARRIVDYLQRDLLPKLFAFISAKSNDLQVSGEGHTEHAGAAVSRKKKVAENKVIVQIPVAQAIVKVIQHLPEGDAEDRISELLMEIVLKLRTKVDKTREAARRILGEVMKEIGISRFRFVLTKLKDQLVHGYQLHVLGYTIVVLMEELASHFEAEAKTIAKEGCGKRTLDTALPELTQLFLDSYLGETAHQKDQTELISTMMEVKTSRALDGFVFLAKHCTAEVFLPLFSCHLSWVLAPPTARETLSRRSTMSSTYVSGWNMKYFTGEKLAAPDLPFINKCRLLGTRVARALLDNPTFRLGAGFDAAVAVLNENAELRDERIAQFEAKDGTRRIRGNLAQHVAPAKRTRRDYLERNFAIEQRPERIDVDIGAPTVLATQQKQRLRKYLGKNAKYADQAPKVLPPEELRTATMLDTVDEFNLKLILSTLKRVLGIGKEGMKQRQRKKKGQTDSGIGEEDLLAEDDAGEGIGTNEERHEDAKPNGKADKKENDEEEEEGEEEEDPEKSEGGSDSESGSDDDSDKVHEELDEMEIFAAENEVAADASNADVAKLLLGANDEKGNGAEAKSKRTHLKGHPDKQHAFVLKHQAVLEKILDAMLHVLRGEGSDAVISMALDVLHALLVLQPPLPSIGKLSHILLNAILRFAGRGGAIKHRALRVVSAVVSNKDHTLMPAEAERLLRIARKEIIERTDHLPMALSVFLSVVGKKIKIPAVYDLVSPITELMLHLECSPAVRNRCVAAITKFLTEYDMTKDKFKSHIDLYIANLTKYPDPSGRMAMLQLLGTLILRLPTPVLQEEALVMFVPLVSSLTTDTSAFVKEKAQSVLVTLISNAGLDSFVPHCERWLNHTDGSFRQTGLQASLAMIEAARKIFTPADASEYFEELRWCTYATERVILDFAQVAEDGATKKPKMVNPTKEAKAKQEMKSWSLLFFALRSFEALMGHCPSAFFTSNCKPALIGAIGGFINHTHPWVKSCSLRILQVYLEEFLVGTCNVFSDSPSIPTTETVPFLADSFLSGKVGPSLRRLTMTAIELMGTFDLDETIREEVTAAIMDPVRESAVKVAALLAQLVGKVVVNSLEQSAGGNGQPRHTSGKRQKKEAATSEVPKTNIASADIGPLTAVLRHSADILQPILAQGSVHGYSVRAFNALHFFTVVFPAVVPTLQHGSEQASAANATKTLLEAFADSLTKVALTIQFCNTTTDLNISRLLTERARSSLNAIATALSERYRKADVIATGSVPDKVQGVIKAYQSLQHGVKEQKRDALIEAQFKKLRPSGSSATTTNRKRSRVAVESAEESATTYRTRGK